MNILVAKNVCKTVFLGKNQPLEILKGINLIVNAGEKLVISGRSGSGKSTLLGLLAGLDSASSGQIILEGQNLSDLDEEGRARQRLGRVGFVFQNFELLPYLTALQNVMLPLELIRTQGIKKEAGSLLKELGLRERMDHYPGQLSGGEQQRVALARAFACQPKILFADEPTGSLDEATGKEIIDLLFRLNEEHHTTLIMVTHDANIAIRSERRLVLAQGLLQ